jgi:Raf kinase inhibitor-like YbhB/YbcL family protein
LRWVAEAPTLPSRGRRELAAHSPRPSLRTRQEAAPLEGRNDFGMVGYRGPCPPHGHRRHRYRFRLHAVTGDLGLAPGAGVQELERAVAAKVLAVAELVGTYQR